MIVLRFRSEAADERRYLADVADALHALRVLLEMPYDLESLAADPRVLDAAETIVAILESEVTS